MSSMFNIKAASPVCIVIIPPHHRLKLISDSDKEEEKP